MVAVPTLQFENISKVLTISCLSIKFHPRVTLFIIGFLLPSSIPCPGPGIFEGISRKCTLQCGKSFTFTQISGDVFRTRVRTRENSKYPAIEMGLRLRGGGTRFTFSVQLLMLGNVNLKCFLQVATFFIGSLKLDIKMMYLEHQARSLQLTLPAFVFTFTQFISISSIL